MAWLVMVSALRRVAPPERASRLAAALEPKAPADRRIPELHRLERELTMGAAREYDLHYRLRPVLREIATARLESQGVRLETRSDDARALLGDALWSIVRPDREAPEDRQAAGPGLVEIRRSIERLERLRS
jgi:hypothetical protein